MPDAMPHAGARPIARESSVTHNVAPAAEAASQTPTQA